MKDLSVRSLPLERPAPSPRKLPWWGTLVAAAFISAVSVTVSLRLNALARERAHQSDSTAHLMEDTKRLDVVVRSQLADSPNVSDDALIASTMVAWRNAYEQSNFSLSRPERSATERSFADLEEALAQPAEPPVVALASGELVRNMAAINSANRAEAVQAGRLATTGVILLMGGAVLFAGGIAWGAERDRRSANLRVAEERLLRASEARFRALVQNSFDMITVLDSDGVVGYQSPASSVLLGRDPQQLLGQRLYAVVHPDDRAAFTEFLTELSAHPGVPVLLEARLSHDDGTWKDVQIAGRVVESAFGAIVLNSRDVSERTQLEERLRHQAYHDALTGLPNRASFADAASAALERARLNESRVAVLLLDLDGFKSLNDTFGHQVGDQALCEVASRIGECARGRGVVARLGGDEFAVLLEELVDQSDAEALAGGILDTLRAPFELDGRTIYLGSSIGVSLSSAGSDSLTVILRQADVAMYAAKNNGRNRFEVFDEELQGSALHSYEVATALRRAFLDGEFRAFYQPIIDLRTGKVCGVEALVRWMKGDGSIALPGDFIQVAEETGLIVEIGEWMLAEACTTMRAWQEKHGSLAPATMSVNVSPSQLHDPNFCGTVENAIATARLKPQHLVVEVTEGTVIRDAELAASTLRRLGSLGVRVALDDFGTGYSSLSYLRELPVHIVKIDKSFIAHAARGDVDGLLLRAIVELATALRLEIIAEGVERLDQRVQLSRIGCHRAQGHLFLPAVSAEEFEAFLTAVPAMTDAA